MPTKKTRKTAAKKQSSKKRSSAKRASKRTKQSTKKGGRKRALICVNDERCFWTTDGKILGSLEDLRDALKQMSETVYRHHVNKERNDFADWVEQVLRDREAAAMLRRSRKPHTARSVVVRRLKFYNI